MKKKADLPTKLCPVCQRPFAWRKKWERCWDEVKYCSDRCRQSKTTASSGNDLPLQGTATKKAVGRK